jgi:hypothetical protein
MTDLLKRQQDANKKPPCAGVNLSFFIGWVSRAA